MRSVKNKQMQCSVLLATYQIEISSRNSIYFLIEKMSFATDNTRQVMCVHILSMWTHIAVLYMGSCPKPHRLGRGQNFHYRYNGGDTYAKWELDSLLTNSVSRSTIWHSLNLYSFIHSTNVIYITRKAQYFRKWFQVTSGISCRCRE